MPKRTLNSRALRQLAEELLDQIPDEMEVSESERQDYVTSLVRQWITYDGNATLFTDEHQVYLVLGKTPLGKPCVVPEPGLPGWMNQLTQDWKINPDDLPCIIDQLNRGQSAEVTNADGIPLRLWVNPKEKSRGVEPLVKEPVPAGTKRDNLKIAARILEQELGDLDPDELEALARSVVRQWQKYQATACVFLDKEQVVFTLTELGEGNCRVAAQREKASLELLLRSLGFSSELVPEVIARINLGTCLPSNRLTAARALDTAPMM
jgi:hypothetical protein